MNKHTVSETLAALEQGVLELTTSQRWTDFLRAQSTFREYSYRNALLIAKQCPQATRVAGFRAWRSLGRDVRKGERAIWILAPRSAPHLSDGEEPKVVGFVSVPVFDVSQTEGNDLPVICSKLSSWAGGEIFVQLCGVAKSLGFTVELCHLEGGVNGECVFTQRLIRIEEGNRTAQRVKSLAHELMHAVLHARASDRAQAELEAESGAFIICKELGIDSDEYTFGYLASWAGDGSFALASIHESCEQITVAVRQILSLYEYACTQTDPSISGLAYQ
jgi:antirestriction protein ArdC